MNHSICRLPEVKYDTGLSRSAIYQRMAEDKFPKQIKLGSGRAVGWLRSDIQTWIKEQVAESQVEG